MDKFIASTSLARQLIRFKHVQAVTSYSLSSRTRSNLSKGASELWRNSGNISLIVYSISFQIPEGLSNEGSNIFCYAYVQ